MTRADLAATYLSDEWVRVAAYYLWEAGGRKPPGTMRRTRRGDVPLCEWHWHMAKTLLAVRAAVDAARACNAKADVRPGGEP